MPPRSRLLAGCLLALALICVLPSAVARAEPGVQSYALVVGSNDGGDGQGRLEFAERDAERMAAVLGELGRMPPGHITLLRSPKARDIAQALAELRAKLTDHADKGERAQLLFYYSGHARAHALSLGTEELPLDVLRESLTTLPSTLTVVVLDACQSGAFSGVKGAAPAADFSVSSVAELNQTGIAVMASSTGSELSQESRGLGSSYFTHHLLTSLRGAGDLDRNGRVSLDEAYAYAYQHTLSDTARTQVGSQHATLETDLTGRGDVPLSYPVDADAQLRLSADTAGKVLVQQASGGAVMAELIKVAGAPLLLALPSGAYEVLVREERTARSCEVTLKKGALDTLALETCKEVALPHDAAKFDPAARARERREPRESWFLEGGLGFTFNQKNAYLRTLDTFDLYTAPIHHLMPDVAFGYQLHQSFSVLARYDQVERREASPWSPSNTNLIGDFRWRTHTMTAGGRFRLPLAGRWLVAVAEFDLGLVWTHSRLEYKPPESVEGPWEVDEDNHFALALRGLAGFTVAFAPHVGLYLLGGYTRAPALQNEFGQKHESGGGTLLYGLRMNGVKGWW